MKDTMPQVAKYWNTVAHEFDSIYTGQGKTGLQRWMDRYFRADIYGRYEWVMRKSGALAGKTVCDIGCGSGRFVTELAKRGAAHVKGIDVAPEMLKLAEELVKRDGVADRCSFQHADILDAQVKDVFDETIAIGFWDYIADPSTRLKLIRGMTRNVFLSAWPRYWTWRMPVRKVRLHYVLGCPVYFFRKGQVYRLLEEAGFEVVSCETIGKLFCVEAKPR